MSQIPDINDGADGDGVWNHLVSEALSVSTDEPLLAEFMNRVILSHKSLEQSSALHLALKLGNDEMSSDGLRMLFENTFLNNPGIGNAMRADVLAIVERDPACQSYLDAVLYYKGFMALQSYRAAHALYKNGRRSIAMYIHNRASEVFQVDIHPAAIVGRGVLIDHATGVVIGETSVVGNNVSMLHSVTLGGNGKEKGDRHPKIGDGVLISAGAKVLGNIKVGECSKIGSGSVVLQDIPSFSTAVGVPAQVVGSVSTNEPSRLMDHRIENE